MTKKIFELLKKKFYLGSPFKLFVKGKLLNEIIRPNFAQVGLPYILTRN